MNRKILSLTALVCMAFAAPLPAAVTTMSGGVSTGYEYFDRSRDNSVTATSSNDEGHSRFRISPFVTIVSATARQSVDFTYAPSFWYDVDESENDIDQKLTLDYMRALSRRWNFTISDNLSITDEFNSFSPTVDPDTGKIISVSPGAGTAGDILRDERGRRKYTNNSVSLGTSYMYLEDSSAALDYTWTLLRNDQDFSGSNYQDYDKHDFSVTLAHRLNSEWKATAVAGYIKGLYDSIGSGTTTIPADSDDVNQYRASLLLGHQLSFQHSLSGLYSYNQSDYESTLRRDSEIHDVTLGWGWNVSPKLNLNLGAGPTYTKQEGTSGDWNTNANFALDYRLEKGGIGFTASRGTTTQNFSGTDERGNSEYWRVQSNVRYNLYQYATVSAYLAYNNEDRDETTASGTTATETFNVETYSAGCALNYRFYEHYTAGLSYGYVQNTSENANDDYDDHRIALTLSYEKDFYQW